MKHDRHPDFTAIGLLAGVDEAGRGPLAGPVVAAAVIFPGPRPRGLNDSKKLNHEQREALYGTITSRAYWGTGAASVSEIDALNILQASLLAMRRAVEAMGVAPELALVDGHMAPRLTCNVRTMIDGDALHSSVAAASIVAKVTRDRMMRRLAEDFPGYGWERNAGYGTGEHQQAMVSLGVTPHHRKSFAPVRALLEVTDLFSYAS